MMKPANLPNVAAMSQEEQAVYRAQHKKEWEEVCAQPLFQWLKHGEGRMVMELLTEGKISIGKAAQTIATVFMLKREEIVPCIYCEDQTGRTDCVLCKGTGLVAIEPEQAAPVEEQDSVQKALEEIKQERDQLLSDWNALVKASGSRTNGGAVAHVSRMRRQLETSHCAHGKVGCVMSWNWTSDPPSITVKCGECGDEVQAQFEINTLLEVAEHLRQASQPAQPGIIKGRSTLEKLEFAMSLLRRTSEEVGDNPPDEEWFRDYFLLTGEHAILVDGSWETGSVIQDIKDEISEEDPEWKPDDEVNAGDSADPIPVAAPSAERDQPSGGDLGTCQRHHLGRVLHTKTQECSLWTSNAERDSQQATKEPA